MEGAGRRTGGRALALLAAAAVLLLPAGAAAQEVETPTCAEGEALELMPGVDIAGATVSEPGEQPRRLDAGPALAFMQSWYPSSVLTRIPNERPPEGLPVTTVTVVSCWEDAEWVFPVYYAADGATGDRVWVGAPPYQSGWWLVTKENWIRSPFPDRSRDALAGTAKPEVPPADEPADEPAPTSEGGSDDGGGIAVWPLVAGAAVVAVLGGLFVVRRGRAPASA